jgi:hypothetical protein
MHDMPRVSVFIAHEFKGFLGCHLFCLLLAVSLAFADDPFS